jgi:predicted aconitase with swiveling domain
MGRDEEMNEEAGSGSKIKCHRVSSGKACGPALVTRQPISFLGNVNPESGMVVDPSHELYGRCICGSVLIFPGGKGSTVGSYVIYQLSKNGAAPAAMVNIRTEPIVAVGAIISGIPLVDRVPESVLSTKDGCRVEVDADSELITILD